MLVDLAELALVVLGSDLGQLLVTQSKHRVHRKASEHVARIGADQDLVPQQERCASAALRGDWTTRESAISLIGY